VHRRLVADVELTEHVRVADHVARRRREPLEEGVVRWEVAGPDLTKGPAEGVDDRYWQGHEARADIHQPRADCEGKERGPRYSEPARSFDDRRAFTGATPVSGVRGD
jgi:hypothetical protein